MQTSALEAEHVEDACRQLVMSVARYLPQEKCVWSKHKASLVSDLIDRPPLLPCFTKMSGRSG